MQNKQEIERELELAKLMAADLEKLWKSYAKKALASKQEREYKQRKRGFLEYDRVEDLIDAWGGAYIDEDTYYRGLAYFEAQNKPPELSVIEAHRKNIKDLLERWKGTIRELDEELCPPNKGPKENAFEKMARLEREERYRSLM